MSAVGPPAGVSLLVTCLVDLFRPAAGLAAVRLLRRRRLAVRVPRGQTCCGLPLFNSGYRALAARVARRTIGLFAGTDPVVIPSGSCAWMVKAEYPHLFPDDPATTRAAQALAARVVELSQLLASLPVDGGPAPEAATPGRAPLRVAYHDSCHLLRGLGEAEAPRRLLRRVPGVELVELPDAEECCGFGGSFAARLPEVSGAILGNKLARIRESGADALVACDAGCLMQIEAGARRAGERVRVLHLAELLSSEEDASARG